MATKTTTKNESRGLTDLKVNPPNKTAALPIVKASIAEFLKADEEGNRIIEGGQWAIVRGAFDCRFVHFMSEAMVIETYKAELGTKYADDILANKLKVVKRAIRIAFAKEPAEVENSKKVKSFYDIYLDSTIKKEGGKGPGSKSRTSNKDVRINKASDNGEEPKTGWNRYEEKQKEEETKQRSAESGSLNAVVIRMISDNRLTPQMMVRAVSTYIADDLDATKEVICSLLEENEWCHEVAAKYCKENPFSERDR